MAAEAAASFNAQDWPVKELVIVNGTGRSLRCENATEILFTTCPWNYTELLNIALNATRGEWCAILTDDAWYAPQYVREQMKQPDPAAVSVVVDTLVHYLNTGKQEHVRRWELASVLFYRRACIRFVHPFSVQTFLRTFTRQRLVESSSPIVTKFLHEPSRHDSSAVHEGISTAAPTA